VEKFVELLNHLHVGIRDMDYKPEWILVLLDTIQSPEGAQYLSNQSWELLVELTISMSGWVGHATYSPQVMVSLLEAQEWDRLECWVAVVWMVWPPEADEMTEELENAMVVLFRQETGTVQKLTQWMEWWSKEWNRDVLEVFQRICKLAPESVQQDLL